MEISWRRRHGDSIVASVTYDADTRHFEAAASCAGPPEIVTRHKTKLRSLHSAKAVADHMARRTFRHKCDYAHCGNWTGGDWLAESPP